MKKILVSTGFFFGILMLVMNFYLISNKNNSNETVDISKPSVNSITYIVKEFNGNVAVFTKNSKEKPFKITTVCTNHLPKKDQEILKTGIEVTSQGELNSLLEDLCS